MAMTSNPVILEIDGCVPREVQDLRYSLRRHVDADGQPTSKVTIEGITLRVKALEDGNTEFAEWMCDTYEHKSGKIIFNSTDKFIKMKELSFERGYIVYYQETFNASGGVMEELEISPQKITIGGAELEETWARSVS